MEKLKGKTQNFEFWVVVLSVAFLLLPSLVMACPFCKEALFDPGQAQQKLTTAKGYALSIGLLLSMPLGLVGGVTALVVRAYRRRRRVDTPPLSG